jgi:signal transduction histidine kinase
MMLQAVAHDVKNKLAELAMRLMERDIEAAALALDAADKLSQALLLDSPEQLTPQIDAASPVDLVEELTAVHRQLFADKTIRLGLDAAPTLWYYDVALMRLALTNILHNALKHCRREVSLRVYRENGYLLFEIRDDGPGYSSDLPGVSDTSARHPGAGQNARHTTGHSTGHNTGMGLRLSRKIVRAHKLAKDGVERSGWMKLHNDSGAVARLALP